jgi:hypothetical protein
MVVAKDKHAGREAKCGVERARRRTRGRALHVSGTGRNTKAVEQAPCGPRLCAGSRRFLGGLGAPSLKVRFKKGRPALAVLDYPIYAPRERCCSAHLHHRLLLHFFFRRFGRSAPLCPLSSDGNSPVYRGEARGPWRAKRGRAALTKPGNGAPGPCGSAQVCRPHPTA